jgi:hypothetical protein
LLFTLSHGGALLLKLVAAIDAVFGSPLWRTH